MAGIDLRSSTSQSGASVVDADATTKGVVQLAGDLGGTAASPTVPGLAGKVAALTPTAIKTAAYTAAVGDLAMMNVAAGATALTLPTAPADKAQIGYRAIGATTTTPLVITAGAGATIGTTGATTASIPLADEVTVLQYQAASTRWLGVANVKTQASLDSRYMYGLTLGRGNATIPVGIRAHGAFDNPTNVAVGATGAVTYELFFPLTDPTCTTVLPVFGNWMAQNGWSNGDYDATQAITISAAVKNSDSTIVPFTFNGQHTVTLTPKTAPLAIPDAPVAFDKQVSANDKFSVAIPLTGVWLRIRVDPVDTSRSDTVGTTSGSSVVTDVSIVAGDAGKLVTATGIPANTYVGTVTAGTSFTLVNAPGSATTVNATATGSVTATITATIPSNMAPYANNDTLSTQNTTDYTLPGAGTVSGGAGSNFYGPALLLGRSKIRKPIAVVVSDSILDGYSEDFHSPYFGPVARAAVNLGYPLVKLSRGGETALAWTTAIGRRYRTAMLEGCTHAIVSLGTNDGMLTTANEPANEVTLEARFTAIGTLLNSLGIKAWLSTIPPRTTSTDAWATTTNQTPVSGSQITPLQVVNDWIRAVPAPFTGIYDLADDCMSARNSGLWAAGSTTDGVHPSNTLIRGTISTNVQTLMATWSL